LGAESFNLFNDPQFHIPAGLHFGAPANFGQITSAWVNPRLVQSRAEVRVLSGSPLP
jgi:hypothetical protein